MNVKAANGLVRCLKAEGVPWVACYPTNHVNNALGEEGLPIMMMGEERFAVAIADAFSRVTNGKRIGVCTIMSNLNAAGIQMAFGAIGQAWEDSSPVLVITEGVSPGATRHTHFDIASALRPVTKWVGEIDKPELVPDYVRRAYTHLRSGRPGPVLLILPRNLGEYDEDEHPYRPVKGWRSGPDPDDVKAAVKALLAAKKPLLYVGEGTLYADAAAELLQFAELAQVPVLTTLKAKSVFPENHPLSVGARGAAADHFLHACDVLFAIGSSLFPNRFSHAIPEPSKKTIVQCNVDLLDINRSYETHHAVIGDAKLTLQALIAEVSAQTGGGVKKNQALLDEIKAGREAVRAKFGPWMESNEQPINPYRVFGDLMKVLDPKSSFVTADSGNTRDQTSTVYEAQIPRGYLGWGNVSTLGFSLAAAVGAKLAYPERQVVNVTGDAGVCYMMGNFEAVARYKLGITTVHINNGGYSGYGPGFWGPGHDPYTWKVSDHSEASMSAMARALGYYGEAVAEPSEIIPALKRALDENARSRPAYLEFICSQHPVHGGWVGR
jgi:thiamine pyrophosphate-dependent acetolactate synthase large subunit-like protein